MFLIEDRTKAIIYTGDIRCKLISNSFSDRLLDFRVCKAEPWWVNTLIRNPVVVPYRCGIRRIDKIYLDTTFATNRDFHREFPTKAEGLTKLLSEVSKYPPNTVFHFHAWTLGYEEVWIALASALNSQVWSFTPRKFRGAQTTLDPCRSLQDVSFQISQSSYQS